MVRVARGSWCLGPFSCLLLGGAFVLCGLAGSTASRPSEPEFPPAGVNPDSLRWADFEALSPHDQKDLRKQARQAWQDAGRARSAPARLELLVLAVEADPTEAEYWLDLAEQKRLMGYREEAAAALASARAAFERDTRKKQQREYGQRYCLARAWLDYDRGAWTEGQQWAQQALRLEAGLAGHLIQLLNRSGQELTQNQVESGLRVLLPLDPNTNRPLNHKWAYLMWMHLGNVDWNARDLINQLKQRTIHPEHDLTRWRDFGLICEANGDQKMASLFYRKSLATLPQSGSGWLTETSFPAPGGGPESEAPFWVNQDQEYVTGSLLAYSAHAYGEMKRQTDADDRLYWAERVARGATAAVPRYPFRPWTRLWRSAAFLEMGRLIEAEDDQALAEAYFKEFGIDEPAINPLAGRILLLEGTYPLAAPYLEQAVRDFPDDADAWTDLGLAAFLQRQRPRARTAFDRALELDPLRTAAWHKRGLVNLHEGRFPEAVDDLRRAHELAPQDGSVAEDLAAALRGLQQWQASGR